VLQVSFERRKAQACIAGLRRCLTAPLVADHRARRAHIRPGAAMSKRAGFFLAFLAMLLSAPNAFADMGRVYVSTTGVTVSEDAQKAIILHNNKKEVLILGTELRADRRIPIIRFIPFPSEPEVSLAPKGVFSRLAAIVAKYKLRYVYTFQSKGGKASSHSQGVEVRLNARLGSHDLTVIKVSNVAAFRAWVNKYFDQRHLPVRPSYPGVEAIVADYVHRGFDFFVLDAVDVTVDNRFVDPIAYTFKSDALYYPLKTSNTFGGKGEIELFVISLNTLCFPGSGVFMDQFDRAVGPQGHPYGKCLGLPVKASTSALLVREEGDLPSLYPEANALFGDTPVFIQTMRYIGDYKFQNDILVKMPQGLPQALNAEQIGDTDNGPFSPLFAEDKAICRKKPDRGPCKGMFESYYFDSVSHSCKMFIWGGCQGSVPFRTLDECQKACTMPLPKPPNK
jgi:Kunitz/Bovine pancreatic trypsin inhibitor domain/Uncharacterized protein conserved in bacteria (DUF2330)